MFDEKSIYTVLSHLPKQLKYVIKRIGQGVQSDSNELKEDLEWAKINNWLVTVMNSNDAESDKFMEIDSAHPDVLKIHKIAVFEYVLNEKDKTQGIKVIKYNHDPSLAVMLQRNNTT